MSHLLLPSLGMPEASIDNSSQEPYVTTNQPTTLPQKGLTIAVGLLCNLETAQREWSVLLLDEQNLLVKEEKEGCA
jgi:hypothetical protein